MFKYKKSFRNLKKLIPGIFLGVCCSAFAGNNLIPQLFDQGIKNYSEKKYNAAVDYLGQVVDMDPEHSQARYYLTYSLALSGNNELALKHAEILAKKFPNDKQYKTLVNQIKAEISRTALKKEKQAPTSGVNIKKEVISGGYKSLDKNAEMREPNVDYTPRDIKPARPLTDLEKAIRKIDEEDYDTAEKMLKEIGKKEPKNTEVKHNLGVIYMSRNKYKDAIKYFKEAEDIDSKAFQSLFLMATCYKTIGDSANAEKSLKKATDIKYDDFALIDLAEVEIELGKYNEAESIYKKILSKSPNFSEASVGLAQIRMEQGKLDEAMQMVNDAIVNGSRGEANYVKALILMANKMYPEAVEELVGALSIAPNNQKYILARATAYIKSMDFTRGIDDASSVLNANPDSVPAMLVIADAFIQTSADEEAAAQLDKVEKYGDFAETHRLRGLIAKKSGNDDKAKEEYRNYYNLAGDTPSGAYEYAEFLESISSSQEEAQILYKDIMKKYPNTIFYTRSKEALERLSPDSDVSPDAAFDTGSNNNYRPGSMKF